MRFPCSESYEKVTQSEVRGTDLSRCAYRKHRCDACRTETSAILEEEREWGKSNERRLEGWCVACLWVPESAHVFVRHTQGNAFGGKTEGRG